MVFCCTAAARVAPSPTPTTQIRHFFSASHSHFFRHPTHESAARRTTAEKEKESRKNLRLVTHAEELKNIGEKKSSKRDKTKRGFRTFFQFFFLLLFCCFHSSAFLCCIRRPTECETQQRRERRRNIEKCNAKLRL